jgi:palmitoyltransferase ZDHHC2/15/20
LFSTNKRFLFLFHLFCCFKFYLSEAEYYDLATADTETVKNYILEKKAKDLPLKTRTYNGGIRFCEKCRCIKPDRAHHCSMCETCLCKMDHHCPWVNNCVAHSNYKFFILFLFYSLVYCVYVASTSLEYFIQFWNEIQSFKAGRFHLLFLFFVSIMFSVSLISLLGYHLYLISKNRTTLGNNNNNNKTIQFLINSFPF